MLTHNRIVTRRVKFLCSETFYLDLQNKRTPCLSQRTGLRQSIRKHSEPDGRLILLFGVRLLWRGFALEASSARTMEAISPLPWTCWVALHNFASVIAEPGERPGNF